MIKPTAMEMHFAHYPSEIPIAKALDEGFDVDYAQIYRRNNIELSYYFLGAKTQFKERFGLEQEILAIYDSHEKPDARIFSAIADLLNKSIKTRIDPAIVLIIIEGDLTDIQPMLDKNKEIAFVVIKKDNLLYRHKSPFFLRREITKVIGSMDLYSMSSPLETDTYLFGREDLLGKAVNKTCHKRENWGIFGLRKTGKTSVLFALQRRFNNINVLGVYLDCHKPIYRYRWWRLLEYIAFKIATDDEVIKQVTISPDFYKGFTEDNCLEKFEILIKNLGSYFKQIIIMFDEIEYITPTISMWGATHWDEDFVPFWQTLRSLHQETHGFVCFIVAGVNPYITENAYINNKQNPIFQLIQPTYLNPLPQPVVRNMVRSIGKYLGMKFDEEVYAFLTEEFGGHAYLIRLACSELYKYSHEKLNDYEYIFNIQSFYTYDGQIKNRLKSPCMEIVLSLMWWYPEEYELLKIVCDGDFSFVKEYIDTNRINCSHIISYGLLDEATYDFNIKILKTYINAYGEEWASQVSPFKRSGFTEELLPLQANIEVLSQIYSARAQLEQDLRNIVYVYLGTSVGFEPIKIAQKICEGLKSEDSRELFFGRDARSVMHELYFTDLHSIIGKHWAIFVELFENQKTRFDMNMETIAKYRNDEAHVKPISDTELLNFKNSISWIQHYVQKFKSHIA